MGTVTMRSEYFVTVTNCPDPAVSDPAVSWHLCVLSDVEPRC